MMQMREEWHMYEHLRALIMLGTNFDFESIVSSLAIARVVWCCS